MSEYYWTDSIVSFICNINRTIQNNRDLFQFHIHNSTIAIMQNLSHSLCNYD